MPIDRLLLKYPVVLIHGLGARPTYGPIDYFFGLPTLLRKAGNRVYIANLTSWQGVERRSEELKRQLSENLPDSQKVNLIGHSLGGLDARYAVSRLGIADRVASVTTIGTPNRGSVMGDFAAKHLPELAVRAADRLVSLAGWSNDGLRQIHTRYHRDEFSVLAPNAPGVAYYSATSAIGRSLTSTSLPLFWIPHRYIKSREGDNDGFVSVESAKWGKHICTYVGDHYGQIGQILGRSRGLNYLKFYDEIFSCLKRDGF